MNILILCLMIITKVYSLNHFEQWECGRSKSCVRWSSCELSNCDFGFSWKMINYNSDNYLEIEIVGKMQNSSNGFIALGFSEKNIMNDDGVVTCRIQNSLPYISCGANGNHFNKLFADSDIDKNFFIKGPSPMYGVEFDASSKILRCRFLRLMTPTLMKDKLKDLNNGSKYYILSAKGVANSITALSYHGQNRRISPAMYDLSSSIRQNNIINVNYTMTKLHGCLMILGWILFATNGIMIAYFYKKNWAKKSILGAKLWFQLHRLLQTICVMCVIAGFVIIFVNVGGYSTLGSLPYSAHPILGITATSLMFVNPIIALFRCNPDSRLRWIFNTIHFIVGISAFLCAISAMSIGIQLPSAGPNLPNMNAPWICVVVFLAIIILIFIYGNMRKIKMNNHVNDLKDNDFIISHQPQVPAAGYEIILASLLVSVVFFVILITFVVIY